jgi:hypothetical protein
MTCPECGERTHERWPVVWLGWLDEGMSLELHIHYCSCGWVTVQDWRWIHDEEEASA